MGKHCISLLLGICLSLVSTNIAFAQSADIIPGEILVQYKPEQTPDVLRTQAARRAEDAKTPQGIIRNTAENIQISLQGEKTPEEKLTEIKRVEERLQVRNSRKLNSQSTTERVTVSDVHLITTDPQIPTEQALQELSALSSVLAVQPNYRVRGFTTPNDPIYPDMWHLTKIKAPQAWDITKGSSSVLVAVVDSGIESTHTELASRVVNGYDFVNNDTDPNDDVGHGTFIAGTIGALTNNGVGISGLNWQTQILSVKVLDIQNRGSVEQMILGIGYAANRGAKVINVSIGGNGACPPVLQNKINEVRNAGVTIVVASGNDNVDATNINPASCAGVITVGATSPTDQRASYSNYGSPLDIGAPGGEIVNCTPQTCWIHSLGITSLTPPGALPYASAMGTSMAAPHVAGVVALMLAVNPNLTPDQIENIIKSSGDPITTDRPIGGKRLNAYQAVIGAGGTAPSPTTGQQSSLILNVKFQGITTQRAEKIIRVTIKQGGTEIKPATDMTVTADSTGVYSGTITNIPPGNNYDVYVKGPAHLQKKFSNITLSSGINTQDLIASPFYVGDVISSNTINGQDISYLYGRFGQTVTVDNKIADLNDDGVINGQDVSLINGNFGRIGD